MLFKSQQSRAHAVCVFSLLLSRLLREYRCAGAWPACSRGWVAGRGDGGRRAGGDADACSVTDRGAVRCAAVLVYAFIDLSSTRAALPEHNSHLRQPWLLRPGTEHASRLQVDMTNTASSESPSASGVSMTWARGTSLTPCSSPEREPVIKGNLAATDNHQLKIATTRANPVQTCIV